jgi:hypothetical protein
MTELRQEGFELGEIDLTLGERTKLSVTARHMREQQNREAIAMQSVGEVKLLGSPDSNNWRPAEIEMEWLDRFWRLAGEVSNEDRQVIWGRVLARRFIGQPFSARALDTLATLSGEEAAHLERLAPFIYECDIDDYADIGIIHDWNIGPGHGDLLHEHEQILIKKTLEATGSIEADLFGSIGIYLEKGWAHGLRLKVTNGELTFLLAKRRYFVFPNAAPVEARNPGDYGLITLGNGHGVSQLGREIFSLIPVAPNARYLALLASALRDRGWGLRDQDGGTIEPAEDGISRKDS